MRPFRTALACAAILAFAATAQAAPSARTTELAKRYMSALHMENTMGALMSNMAPTILENIAKSRGAALTSDVKIAFTEAAEESMRAMTPRMVEKMIPVIADTFTEGELEAAVAYYESANGQAMLKKSPELMSKLQPALADLMPVMQADLVGRLCKKIGCDPADLK
jgi:hypothetical protein